MTPLSHIAVNKRSYSVENGFGSDVRHILKDVMCLFTAVHIYMPISPRTSVQK